MSSKRVLSLLAAIIGLAVPLATGATLPTGFAESLLVSGLSSPTAMAFAPDGRLFVVRAGRSAARRSRTARCSPTPFVTLTRGLVGRARPARRRLRPRLRHEPLRLRLLHGDDARRPQPRQPLHRERRRGRRGQRARAARPRQPQRRHQPQRRRHPLRAGRQALRRRRRERQRRQRADARQPARQDPAHNADGTIPTDNPFYAHRRRARTARSGRSACATRSRSPSSRGTGRMFINDVGQSAWEEINDGIAGSNYGWPTTEGLTTQPRASVRRCSPTPRRRHDRRLRDHRRRLLQPGDAAVPGELRRRLLLRRLLQRLDPQLRSRERLVRPSFATGICEPGRPAASQPDGSLYYLARGSGRRLPRVSTRRARRRRSRRTRRA